MKSIKLYDARPTQAVELEAPLDLDAGCQRCALGKRALKNRCMSADGEPGGLLVVGASPSDTEDRAGRPFLGQANATVRALVQKFWQGPVVFDNAIKCSASTGAVPETSVDRCRGYLAAIVREAKPQRILALGQAAIEGLLGRSLPVMSVRRGYAYLSDGTPIFFTFSPYSAAANRHHMAVFQEDVRHACQAAPLFPPQWDVEAYVVETHQDALKAEAELRKSPWFAFDVETAGQPYQAFQIITAAAFPSDGGPGYVWSPESMNTEAKDVLGRLMADKRIGKVGNNLKYDLLASTVDFGVRAQRLYGDNRLMRKLIDADADGSLATMGELVGMGGHKEEAEVALTKALASLKKLHKQVKQGTLEVGARFGFMREDVQKLFCELPELENPKGFAYALLPRHVLLRYVARDALTSRMLHQFCEQQFEVEPPSIRKTWERIVKPAAEAVRQVEEWGIHVDLQHLNQFDAYLQTQQQTVYEKMMAYGEFDVSSPQAVGHHLFERLRLPGAKKTAKSGQYATDAATLETVAQKSKHPLPTLIAEYKSYDKFRSVYAAGMRRFVRADNRIHPNLLLDGARSGRLSCQNPNLQNIPRDGDSVEGKMARDCFSAAPGYVLLAADYSQLELRIAAALSGDAAMRSIFEDKQDFHQRTAEFIAPIVWKIKPEEVKKTHRSAAKTFNFGILYGMGDEGIAARAGCTIEEAARIRQAVLGRFQKLAEWIHNRLIHAKRTGECWTWWDGEAARRRYLWDIAASDGYVRSKAEHSSFNTPIQGTGSDFCLMSLTECVKWIHEDAVPARLVLSVHDSLMFEVREDAVDEVAFHVHRIMTGWPSNGVPIEVDMEVGPSWGTMTKKAVPT